MSAEREISGKAKERIPTYHPRPWSKQWFKKVGQMVIQASKDFMNDSGPQWAASIAYYALLSSIPLLLAILSIASYFVDQDWAIQMATQAVGDFLPEGEEQVEEIMVEAIEARGGVTLLSVGLLLWSGSRVFGVLARALNVAYDVDEYYSFIKRTFLEMVMMITVGVLFVIAVTSRFIINFLTTTLNVFELDEGFLFIVLTNVVPIVLLLVAFFLIYHFVPRVRVNWKASMAGAVVATLLFSIGRPLFLGYINQVAEFHLVYGSLGVLVIIVLWVWLMGIFLLYGGQIAGHTQNMLIEGKTAEYVAERHKARSPGRLEESVKELDGSLQADTDLDSVEEHLDKNIERRKQRELGRLYNEIKGEHTSRKRRSPTNISTEKAAAVVSIASLMGAVLLWIRLRRKG
jgi:membrane protein